MFPSEEKPFLFIYHKRLNSLSIISFMMNFTLHVGADDTREQKKMCIRQDMSLTAKKLLFVQLFIAQTGG